MRVLYVQYTNPGAYPPIVRGAQLLAEAGADVAMLGTRVSGTDPLNVVSTPGIRVELMPPAATGWRLKAHYARYAAWVAREARTWEPDWIYASDVLSAPIATALVALTGARVVYHEHDTPARDHESWMINRCLDARRRLMQEAAVVVAPNAERARRLSAAAGRPVATVWNCPRRPSGTPVLSRDGDCLRIVFRGSVNADRLPLVVIDALARVQAPMMLDIAGYETAGSRGYLEAVSLHAQRLGVNERVRVLGTLAESDLAAICDRSDIGLALMPMSSPDENMQHMTGASNKVFEYLSCGAVPLVSDLPDWRRAFVDAGCAIACNSFDVDSIAAAFGWAAAHTAAVRTLAARGWERLQLDWNYESQFAPVLDAVLGRSSVASSEMHHEAGCAS